MVVDVKGWMKERRDNRFPNASTVAHFSLDAQMITLDAYSRDDLPKAMQGKDHDRAREILATVSHELTHWADLVGTLWGREYIERLYHLYNLMPRPDEADFWRFLELHDEKRRLTFPRYYHTVVAAKAPHGMKKPWRIRFSAGREIDTLGRLDATRPILFVRFDDNETGAPLIRQPLTVGALLETTAVASEIFASFAYVRASVPAEEQTVAFHQASASLSARLYDPDLTLYSAPVHLFAKMAGITEAAQAYHFAATLAHLCLNLTADQIGSVLLPSGMEEWQDLFPHFKERSDRAFVFAAVCFNLERWQSDFKLDSWIDTALLKSGLPNSDTIIATALDKMAKHEAAGSDPLLREAHQYMLELGAGVAKGRLKNSLFGPTQAQASIGLVPAMIDSEGELFHFPGQSFDPARFDPIAMIDRDWALDGYTRNLLTSCR